MKFLLMSLLFASFSFFVFAQDSLALDSCDTGYELVSGVCIPTSTGLPDPDPADPVWAVLDTFLMWLLSIVGLIAIIAFAVSGIMYLTSGGNENQIDAAKKYMVWSIVGVIVALMGYIVVLAIDTWLSGSSYF